MRVLVVIDPLERLNLETETTLLLVQELERRQHEVWMALPHQVAMSCGLAHVHARRLSVNAGGQPLVPELAPYEGTLDWFDLILMRQDPPVDDAYRFVAHTVALARRPLVVNCPRSVLVWNEKLLPLHFPQFCPPTLVSRRAEQLVTFAQQFEKVVLKPLTDCSGRGIRIVERSQAAREIPRMLAERAPQPIVAQAYLPEVAAGDKRVFLVDGNAIGAVNRIPAGPVRLANIHQGASVEATELTPREREIVAEVGAFLRREQLWLAGLDLIGGYLTEVNVTSPSALRQINAVSGERLERVVVDFLERKAQEKMALSA